MSGNHGRLFTPSHLKGLLSKALHAAGPRYSPEVHVDLPLVRLFDGLGRTEAFFERIQSLRGSIRRSLQPLSPPTRGFQTNDRLGNAIRDVFLTGKGLIAGLSAIPTDAVTLIDFGQLKECCQTLGEAVATGTVLLREVERQQKERESSDATSPTRRPSEKEEIQYALHKLYEAEGFLRELDDLLKSEEAQLANIPALLLIGEAGTGKTHLFCDVARYRLEKGLVTVLLMGQHFRKGDPLKQIAAMVGMPSPEAEGFFSAIQQRAKKTGRRALILIDALNEGDGVDLWMKCLDQFLRMLRQHPFLALAISCRTSYEPVVIPAGLIPDHLVRVEHRGFGEQELEATRTFFDYYGLQRPAIPLLVPEFQNPLFLKLFCKALKEKGTTRPLSGHEGMTFTLEFFIKSLDTKLARDLGYQKGKQLVWKVTKKLAEAMAESGQGWIPRDKAKQIVEQASRLFSINGDLYQAMVSEGVLAEDFSPDPSNEGGRILIVRFPYQKFSDHLVVRYLLKKYFDKRNPKGSLQPGTRLGNLIKDDFAGWRNSGLIEALSVQIPERTNQELLDFVPRKHREALYRGFVQSIIWRDPRKFHDMDKIIHYLNQSLQCSQGMDNIVLDTLLTVSTAPNHPLNAKFLHYNLRRLKLPDRDAWWSIYLRNQLGNHGGVDHLLTWSETAKTDQFDDQSIFLASLTLTWFLTSSNRYLRDRATKCLVHLLRSRLPVLRKALQEFSGVDDPYISERVYAVAYGCVLLSSDKEGISALAKHVYDEVFGSDKPPAHILLRDYARGVIERALQVGIKMSSISSQTFRPPYQSKWPLRPPSPKILEIRYDKQEYGVIWLSVMSFGDFGRYIIGSRIGHFSGRVLTEEWPVRQEEGLSKTQIKVNTWDRFIASLSENQRSVLVNLTGSAKEGESTEFLKSLSENQLRTLRDVSKTPRPRRDPKEYFKVELAQRWIFNRVIKLGWTAERFCEFDRYISYRDHRQADKPERIGKKYQWIAFHEFLAHVADHFWLRREWGDKPPQRYDGPWQLWSRDIDPSLLIYCRPGQGNAHGNPWWLPVKYSLRAVGPEWQKKWLKNSSDCPDPRKLILVAHPKEGSQWLTLEGFYQWEDAIPPDEDRFEIPRRQLWYQVRSYLVKKEQSDSLFTWLAKQNFWNRWMPESHHSYGAFIGEFPWHPSNGTGEPTWVDEGMRKLPHPVIVTAEEYFWEAGGYDCSIQETVSALLPSRWMVEQMGLRWEQEAFRFVDRYGSLVACDPSWEEAGPRVLLFRRSALESFLKSRRLEIVWTVLGEKNIMSSSLVHGRWPGQLQMNGVFRLSEEGLEGPSMRAEFVEPTSGQE